MLKQRRYDQKAKYDIESSNAHNFHKTSFSVGILKIETSYNLLYSLQVSLQDLFTIDLDLNLKI